MKITQEILEALECAINDSGSIYKFAKELGVSHSTVFFWKTGKTTSINNQVWGSCLRKKLRPYLSSKAGEPSGKGVLVRERKNSYGSRPKSYPVVSIRKLAFFDPNVISTAAFLQEYSLGSFFFNTVGTAGAFALRIEENGKNEIFTQGSTLLVESGRPPVSGELAVVKCKDASEASFYIFRQDDDTYKLIPYGKSDAEVVLWEKGASSAGLLDWIYPVLEANIKFK